MKIITWLQSPEEEKDFIRAFSENNFVCHPCNEKNELLKLVDEFNNSVSLIVLDNSIDTMDVAAFCGELKNIEHLHAMIMVAGNGEIEQEIKCLEQGADFFVHRPLRLALLVKLINNALRK